MAEDRVSGDTDMGARHQSGPEERRPLVKVAAELLPLRVSEHGEPRQGVAPAATDCRGQTPDPAPSGSQLGHFVMGELQHTIRWVGANGVDGLRWALSQPVKAIGMDELIHFGQTDFQLRA